MRILLRFLLSSLGALSERTPQRPAASEVAVDEIGDGRLNHRPQTTNPEAIMKKIVMVLPLLSVLLLSTFAHAGYILFYGGDFDPTNMNANALPNENDAIVGGNPYGAATFQNFIIPAGHTWNITSLFTNNLASISPQGGYWELRSGLGSGNGGTLIASGTAALGPGSFEWTATGRNGFGLDEYQAHVEGLNLLMGSGQYWESVVPLALNDAGRSYNSNTFNCFANSCVGTQIDDQQYFDSPFFGSSFGNADDQGAFTTFSSGIDGFDSVPEPSTLSMLGSGLVGLSGLLRRRLLH